MTFDAQAWIDAIVRTSETPLVMAPAVGAETTLDDIIKALGTLKKTAIDSLNNPGALFPARLPHGFKVPDVIYNHFDELIQGLRVYSTEIHPAVRHALLAVALDGPDRDNMIQSLIPLMTGLDNGLVYQPTITWMAMLRPDLYEPKHLVIPKLKGGQEPSKIAQGTTVSILLTEDNIRLNPANMFTSTHHIELAKAKIPAPVHVWANEADKAWESPNPPSTSLWLMSFGNTQKWWPYMTPGSALYNPFFTKQHITDLFLNSTQYEHTQYTTRMSYGIADIYPLKKDAALVDLVPSSLLLDAPLSCNSIMSIYHHACSEQTTFTVPLEWAREVQNKVELTKSLDMLPQYSIFSNDDIRQHLEQYAQTGDPTSLKAFMAASINHQMLINSQTDRAYADAFDIGLPVQKYYRDAPPEFIIPCAPDFQHDTTAINLTQ